MGYTKKLYQELQEKAQWHFDHCEWEYEPNEIPAAYCTEHGVDVTECLPEPIEPDAFDNFQENDLL